MAVKKSVASKKKSAAPKKKAAPRKKAASKKKAVSKQKSRLGNLRNSVSSTTANIVDEVDGAYDVVLREIREGFNAVSEKASKVAKRAAATASDARTSVMGGISEVHPKEMLTRLVDEVEELADDVIDGISSRFGKLREAIIKNGEQEKAGTRKVAKKKTAKKKVAKKKVARKKVTRKKAASKKAPAKKKTTGRTVARKKTTARKKAVKKKK